MWKKKKKDKNKQIIFKKQKDKKCKNKRVMNAIS